MSKRRRNKAQIPTARQGARSAVDRVTAMTQQTQTANVGEATPLPRDPAWSIVPFAPSQPIPPAAINRPRPDTGRSEPRLAELPVGWNLPGSSHRHLPWFILREAADRVTLFRRCIQIRKDHMQGLDWGFRISPDAVAAATLASGGAPRAKVQRDLHEKMSDAIAKAKKFWQVPDRGQDYEFDEWLGLMLEETYVLDALAIYPRMTYGGDLDSLEIIDGSLIKPLRDERGGRPRPPMPAYQQILFGFPRGEFTATVDVDGELPGAMAADELVYKRRVIRTQSPYGYSPVEQALDDGDLYLKRHHWMKAEYTTGAMPQGMFEVAAGAGLTPQQVAELERFYNDLLSGNTEERMKARFLPPGITPSQRGDVGEKYKPDYDLHLLKLAISHFDTVLPELGFTESKGLGSSGYHEGQEDVQLRKTLPIIKHVSSVITRLSHRYLGVPDEIEHYFLGLDDEDEAGADELEAKRWADGVISTNERRQRLGLDPYAFAEADMPLVKLSRGILFLEGASENALPGVEIEPGAPAQEGGAPQPGDKPAEDGSEDAGDVEPPVQPKPGEDPKTAEKAAYRRWVRKGRSRAFEWHYHTDVEVVELTKAGDAEGKGEPPSVDGGSRAANQDVPDGRVVDAELSSDGAHAHGSRTVKRSYGSDLVVGQDDCGRDRSREQVVRPDARRVVAGVTDDLTGGDRTVGEFVRGTVGANGSSTGDVSEPVSTSVGIPGTVPDPAGRSLVYLGPEAVSKDTSHKPILPKESGPSGGPKELDGQTWPAWEIDQETARYWAPEISRAFAGIDTGRLAERWTEVRKSADSEAWLTDQGVSLADALRGVLQGVYGDGFVIGIHSGQYAVDHARDPSVRWTSDWGAWSPGNREAAKAVAGDGLDRLLAQTETVIRSVAKNRMHELGDALAEGLDQGLGSEEIGRSLRAVLDDPDWAYGVAVTETNRAVTFASQETYRANGVSKSDWLAGPGACVICQGNADAGPVWIGQAFPSGVTGPPTHPFDRCGTAPHIE